MFLNELPNINDRLHIIKYKIERKYGGIAYKGVSLLSNNTSLVLDIRIASKKVTVQMYINRIGSKRILLEDVIQEDMYSETKAYSLKLKATIDTVLQASGLFIQQKEVDPLHSTLFLATFVEDRKVSSFEDRGYTYRFVRKRKTYTVNIQNGFYIYYRGLRMVFSTRDTSSMFVKNILLNLLYKQNTL